MERKSPGQLAKTLFFMFSSFVGTLYFIDKIAGDLRQWGVNRLARRFTSMERKSLGQLAETLHNVSNPFVQTLYFIGKIA